LNTIFFRVARNKEDRPIPFAAFFKKIVCPDPDKVPKPKFVTFEPLIPKDTRMSGRLIRIQVQILASSVIHACPFQ
jgi:hypothetical protein